MTNYKFVGSDSMAEYEFEFRLKATQCFDCGKWDAHVTIPFGEDYYHDDKTGISRVVRLRVGLCPRCLRKYKLRQCLPLPYGEGPKP